MLHISTTTTTTRTRTRTAALRRAGGTLPPGPEATEAQSTGPAVHRERSVVRAPKRLHCCGWLLRRGDTGGQLPSAAVSPRSVFVSSRRAKRLQKAARRAALRPLLERHTRRPLVCPSVRCVCKRGVFSAFSLRLYVAKTGAFGKVFRKVSPVSRRASVTCAAV